MLYDADLVVARKETVAEGVVALNLADSNGRALPAWTPGAHINLVLPDPSLTRQYSLCSHPADQNTRRIAVLREANSRDGSQLIHDVLQAGNTVRVRGHRGYFAPQVARIALEKLLGALPSIELDAEQEVVVWGWFFRGPRELRVRWST